MPKSQDGGDGQEPRATGKLTDKQKRFAFEYLKDLNGAQAAIRAGYSKNTAREQAYDLLTRPHIKHFVEKLKQEREARTEITLDSVMAELARNAFLDHPKRAYDAEAPARIKALELLGKHLGGWKEKDDAAKGNGTVLDAFATVLGAIKNSA